MSPAVIVFAAFFTGVTSLSIGLALLQAFRVRMHRHEALTVGYVIGSGVLSLIVFAMLTFWIARPWWFATVGVVAIGIALWRRAWRIDGGPALAPVPRLWKWIFAALLLSYGTYTFVHALAPEVSPDGIGYHLGTVNRWFHFGGLEWRTTNMYANMPMAVEMLFLFAFSFGQHSAAALVHWQFLMILPLLLLNIGRRFGHPIAGAVAGLLLFIAPVTAIDGASSYVDVATAAVVVSLFSMLLLFEQHREMRLLILIGALGGLAYGCKMTASPALPFAVAYVAWVLYRYRLPLRKPLATVVLAGALFIVPWLAKNAVMLGNPFSPFLNRYFPNPYVRVSFEEEYRAIHRDYYGRIKSWSQIPQEVTVKGANLQGLLGSVFLLAPIGLVALRWPLGRRALLAALAFGVTYPSNIGTRFLLMPLPFVSLAMGLTLSHWRGTAAAVVLFHAAMSWPSVLAEYTDQYAWRLAEFRWREALRIVPLDAFWAQYSPGALAAKLVEENVPPHGRVLTFGSVAEAYTTREILVDYQAGFNNVLGDILAAGFNPAYQGTQKWRFQFTPIRLRRLRVVQTKSISQNWAVSEIRVFSSAGGELPRTHAWGIRAHPNPWDVQFAFDNCPITRWSTWQASRPGDYIDVDIFIPFELSAVQVELAPDQVMAGMRLEGEVESGVWRSLSENPQLAATEPVMNSRLTATADLKRLGVTHLAIGPQDYIAQELAQNQTAWGITLVGEAAGIRLYKFD